MHRSPSHLVSARFLSHKTYGIVIHSHTVPPDMPTVFSFSSLCQHQKEKDDQHKQQIHKRVDFLHFSTISKTSSVIGSPAQVQKLIASQTDSLLAKEIFDLASQEPNFHHSYSSYHTLILKLGRSRYFSLMQGLLSQLKSQGCPIAPSLFSHIIRIYGEAQLPEKALNIFYSIPKSNTTLLPKHLNLILEVLVAYPNFIRPAFDLFKSAHSLGISPNVTSYNILMRAFCFSDNLSIAYSLFNQMFKRDIVPDIESYRILMQGLCRKSQVNRAVDLLDDMLNKGFVPDTLSYTTLLNSLCRKKRLKEAYKLLCRMKVKGCNPDIVHYNTVIIGFCREGRARDALKVLEDMPENGCLPNLVSYRTLVAGLCNQGMYDEAKTRMHEMICKGFSPHFSVSHALIRGLCTCNKIDEACGLVENMLSHGEALHVDTWMEIIPRICEVDMNAGAEKVLKEVLEVEITFDTRRVVAAANVEEYLIKKIRGLRVEV